MAATDPELGRGPRRLLLAFSGLRMCWALALLLAPGRVGRVLSGKPPGGGPDPLMRRVERLLGLRHGVQALAEASVGPRSLVPGAAVDALHASSMVVLARLDTDRRRPAEHDAVVEATFVAVGLVLAGAFRRLGQRPAADPTAAPAVPA